ncbi:MAG: M23 family metallopeptidase [Bacteroidales bacterium]|nr:M23 family metallopeptidase [Bacteroidales bacterium]
MSKKFKFNIDNLDFQKDSKSTHILKIVLTQFVAIVLLSIVIFLALSYFTDTPFEKNLKHQNKIIEQEYDKMIAIYKQNEINIQLLEKQDNGLYKIMFGTAPPENKKLQLIQEMQDKKPKELAKENNKKVSELFNHLSESEKGFEDLMKILEEQKEDINHIPSIQPVPNQNLNLLLYGYGERLDPVYHTPDFHSGIDFNAPSGTPVFATADGVVSKSGVGKREFGNVIEIESGDFTTVFHHLDKVSVYNGKIVKRGDLIGYVGTTGKSLVSHLHYEIRYKGEPINPIFFFFMDLTPSQFSEIFEQSTRAGISLD